MRENASRLKEHLPELDDEDLKVLFGGLDEVGTTTWQLQAEIIAELQSRGRYGENVIGQIAKFLGVAPRRIHELAQIHREILSKRPEFADLPLDKTHFTVALKGKKYGKDPIKMLEEAADTMMSSSEMKRKLDFGDKILHTNYYSITKINYDSSMAKAKTIRYISPYARIIERGKELILELYEE